MNKEQAIEKAKQWNRENPYREPIKYICIDEDHEWWGYREKPSFGSDCVNGYQIAYLGDCNPYFFALTEVTE